MKPIKLTMTAFGPYAGVQEIDFRSLEGRSFFLIHGATGAGKTTILDAMCFALYGQTSGNDRKAEQMRSQHTKSELTTEVVFDFTLGNSAYRVKRSLKRERVKDPESPFKSDKAILWNRTNIASEQDLGVELASKWTKVTEEIEALFGFESAQFRQVIMLPQDKFQQLLKAKSDERENLFKVLFQTKQFEDIEDGLKKEAAALALQIQNLIADQRLVLQMAEVQTLDELEARRKEAATALENKLIELSELRAHEQRVGDQLRQGQDIYNQMAEREQAEIQLREIESKLAEYTAQRHRLERARQAAELIELENAMLNQQHEAEAIEEKRQRAQRDLETAVGVARQSVAALTQELGRQGERDEARRIKDQLDNLHGQVGELEQTRAKFKSAKALSDEMERKREVAKKQLDSLHHQLAILEQDLENAGAVAGGLVSAQQAEMNAQNVYEQWLKLRDIAERWKAATQKESDEAQRLQLTETDLAQARDHRDHLEETWRTGQAALLAGQLADNTPCPVCGSIHHPQPATSSHLSPSDADLKAARVAVSALEVLVQKARNELLRLHEATVRLDEARKPLIEALGETAHLQLARIKSQREAASSALSEAKEKAIQMEAVKQKHGPLKERRITAEMALVAAEGAYKEAATQLATAKALLDERQSKVPAELDEPHKLGAAKKQNDSIIKELELALETAQTNDSQAKQRSAAGRATLDQLSTQASTAKQRAEEQHSQFVERTVLSGFASVNDYERSKLSMVAIANLDREIRTFDGSLQAARERVDRARLATQSLVKPDLEQLQMAYRQAKDDVEAAVRNESELQTRIASYAGFLAKLKTIEKDLSQKEGEYAIVGRIAEVANGDNIYKMTFHRFVLSALLEDILADATQRLQIMSRGRYLLQRAASLLKGRRVGGLDLIVNDTWADNSRPVETLSGGESFYASLALALGLREIVQAYAGGIRLDTIFIDEGFGSLDTDTLDLAIRILEGLKEGGRLVGIISHVESLRERIPVRLQVTAGVKGSKAEFLFS